MPVPDSSQYISSVKGRTNTDFKVSVNRIGPKNNSIAAVRQYADVKKGLQFISKHSGAYTITATDISTFNRILGVNGFNNSPIKVVEPRGLTLINESGQTVWAMYYNSIINTIRSVSTADGILPGARYTNTDILTDDPSTLVTAITDMPIGYLLLNTTNEFYDKIGITYQI